MERSIFAADTSPGSPGTQSEIKTLICYLLVEMKEPVSFQQLHQALRENQLVNYFELTESLGALVKSGHLEKTGDEIFFYTTTPLGGKTATTLDDSLPISVREKALESTRLIVSREKRLREVSASIDQLASGGYSLRLSIPHEDESLLSFELFSPTLEEASKLKIGFLNDPVFIYKSVMALLSGDKEVLGKLLPEKRQLFSSETKFNFNE